MRQQVEHAVAGGGQPGRVGYPILACGEAAGQFQPPVVAPIAQAQRRTQRIDRIQRQPVGAVVAACPGRRAAQRPAVPGLPERTELHPGLQFHAVDTRIGHVARLEHHQPLVVDADHHPRLDEVPIVGVIARQAGVAGLAHPAQAQFDAIAGFRLQVRVGNGGVAEHHIGQAQVDVVVGRRTEAMGVVGVDRPGRVEAPDHPELGRHLAGIQAADGHARVVFDEDRVGPRVEPVPVHAQARHQAQATVGQAHLVLGEQPDPGGFADREVAHREHIRQHRAAGRAGAEIGLHAIAQLFGPGPRCIHAPGQVVAGTGAFQGLVHGRQQPVGALVELEAALPADVAAAPLIGVLGGLAVLPVDLPAQAVGQAAGDALHLVQQRNPLPALVVVAVQGAGGGGDHRQRIGLRIVLVAFHGQAQALAVGRGEHQLGQHAGAVALLRIGGSAGGTAAAVVALVFGLLAAAPVQHHHRAPALAAQRGGGAGRQAAPVAFIAELQPDVAVLARDQVVDRIAGHERDHAAERIRAVQGAGRAAHDLHLLERVQVDEIAVGVGVAADQEGIGHGDAIGLDPHPVSVQAADAEPAQAEAADAGGHRHARFVAHQVLDVAGQGLVQALAVDHVHRGGHVHDRPFGAGGGDLDAGEFVHGRGGIGIRTGGGVRAGRG